MSLPLDHLVYATPDMAETVADLGEQLGLSLSPGGKHVGVGTHNALLALGNGSYLEVIGPDPDQPEPDDDRPFGIDNLPSARLYTFAVRSSDVAGDLARAAAAGYDLGSAHSMSRETPEGDLLSWTLSQPSRGGLTPFLIDWGDTTHPSTTAAAGCTLESFRGVHPEPAEAAALLQLLGVDIEVGEGQHVALEATISCPNGTVTLR